jgi:hypothetical protein
MIRIFISHASRDTQTIINILSYLPKYISKWIDQHQIIAGEGIISKIVEGINQSNLYILFVSPEATESEWVKKEINVALRKSREAWGRS